ncbi:MAG: hypothetical protein NZ483_05880 [Verrucomicrobiae bacterium]|nr:hypothetical protein [Verrucomicrobiae bacterium]
MRMLMISVLLGLLVVGELAKAGELVTGVVLNVRLGASRVLVGEPVQVRVTLENRGSGEVRVLYPAREPFQIGMSRDGASYEGFWPFERMATGPRGGRVLKPAERLSKTYILVRNVKNVLQPPPKYEFPLFGAGLHQLRVTAQLLDEDGTVQSVGAESIPIEVREPEGLDQQMWQAVRGESWYPRLLQVHMLTGVEAGVEGRIVSMLDRFAQSVYAQHIAFGLGQYHAKQQYRVGGEQVEAEKVRGEHRRKAEEYFGLAARMEQVPWVREEAMLELAKLRGGAEAIRLCEEALQRWPEGFLREEFLRLREAWQRELELEAKFKPPEDGGMRAERELKALGYDLENLTEEQRRFLASEVEGGTWLECEERGLSNEECDELLYRRYKEWVVKNLKPVRGPEAGLRWAVGRREGW